MVQIPTFYMPATRMGFSQKVKKAIKKRFFKNVRGIKADYVSSWRANTYWGLAQNSTSIRWTAYEMSVLGKMTDAHVLQVLQKEKTLKVKDKNYKIYDHYSYGRVTTVALKMAYDAGEPGVRKMLQRRKGLQACFKSINIKKIQPGELQDAIDLYSGIMHKGWDYFSVMGHLQWQQVATDIGKKFPHNVNT